VGTCESTLIKFAVIKKFCRISIICAVAKNGIALPHVDNLLKLLKTASVLILKFKTIH
jgi:hypothetical protein